MIDLKYTYEQFCKYIQKYDKNNEMINLKIAHMIRVMNTNIEFAKLQGLDDESIELAGVIGLLHDVGRFVQVDKYNTFIDSQSVDHCKAGVDLLFKEGLIEYFVSDNSFYYVIEKAIGNHGRFEIEDGLDVNTLIQCKLIRDSDKTDIYEVMLRENPEVVFDGDIDLSASINAKVLENFYNHKLVSKTDVKTVVDDLIRKIAFIYNYYFDSNLQYINNKNYIRKMTERFLSYFKLENDETIEQIMKACEYGEKYLTCKKI